MDNTVNRFYRVFLVVLIIVLNVGCDQVSKNVVRKEIDDNAIIRSGVPQLTITKVENTGAFLSIGNSLSNPLRFILLSIIPCIALLLGFLFLVTTKHLSKIFLIGSSFVIGGGLGNIYDRIALGSVTDFLHIDFVVFQTGVFNIADMSILFGIIILFLNNVRSRSQAYS